MNKIENVPCKCGGSSLLMLTDKGFHAVWCSCGKVEKNKILTQLRENGWDIGSQHFQKRAKAETKPPVNEKLLGKFDGVESLEKALYSLAERMDIPKPEVDEQVGKLGLPTAYRRLCAAFSSRKVSKT